MSEISFEEIRRITEIALKGLLEVARMSSGQILVVGCSTSEVVGKRIGTSSSQDAANAILSGIMPILKEKGIFLAAQCCEHLNRALIIDRCAAEKYGLEPVNVVPVPNAGGSFASAVYAASDQHVAVETADAHAGMDIGNTLIGMHLRRVVVPVRVSVDKIGKAHLVCARTRPKYIGGSRAVYNEPIG